MTQRGRQPFRRIKKNTGTRPSRVIAAMIHQPP